MGEIYSESKFRDVGSYSDNFFSQSDGLGVGMDFYSAPEFEGGLTIYGQDVAMKIGSFVKADFIHDLNPIDATASFDTTTIPVGARPRTNARCHARWKLQEFTGAARSAADSSELLPLFGWMVGMTHEWTDLLSSSFTYAENRLDNAAYQPADDVHRATCPAANLIWNPLDRVRVGDEYPYGLRENVDREVGSAHRVQAAFFFDLP